MDIVKYKNKNTERHQSTVLSAKVEHPNCAYKPISEKSYCN